MCEGFIQYHCRQSLVPVGIALQPVVTIVHPTHRQQSLDVCISRCLNILYTRQQLYSGALHVSLSVPRCRVYDGKVHPLSDIYREETHRNIRKYAGAIYQCSICYPYTVCQCVEVVGVGWCAAYHNAPVDSLLRLGLDPSLAIWCP